MIIMTYYVSNSVTMINISDYHNSQYSNIVKYLFFIQRGVNHQYYETYYLHLLQIITLMKLIMSKFYFSHFCNLPQRQMNIKGLLLILFITLNTFIYGQQRLGDNLGSHQATKDLNMNSKNVVNAAGMVIGAATLTNTNVILDIKSSSKVLVIPRVNNINLMTGTIDNGSMAYDIATNKFLIRENDIWTSFGNFSLNSGQIMLGSAGNRAIPVTISGDVTIDNTGITMIGTGKVTANKLGSAGTADANKVFGTNITTGIPELISRADLAIPKYTQTERDALTGIVNNYLIFNTSNRQLQIYDANLPGWVALGSAPASSLPTLSTNQPGTITEPDQVSLSGNVSATGGYDVTARGIAYSLTSAPTTSNYSVNAAVGGTGAYTVTLANLSSNTDYYARAYATNAVGTSYGNEITFRTAAASLPVVSTGTPATNITNIGATIGGNVTAIKGSPVTVKGIVAGFSTNPTLATAVKTTADGSGIGSYTTELTGLDASKLYYVRAYATNAVGTAYGANVTFTTAAPTAPIIASTTAVTKSGASQTGGGTISSNGGAQISNYGIAWSTTNTFPATLTSSNSYSGNAGTVGSFTAPITNVIQNTSYYVWAFATNSVGTTVSSSPALFTTNGPPQPGATSIPTNSYGSVTITGNITTDGGSAITDKGFIYSTTSTPTMGAAGAVTLSAGTDAGSFSNTLTTLNPGTTYFVRTYATNAIGGPIYGSQSSFTTANNGTVSWTTSGARNWTVPNGVTSVNIKVGGGAGGNFSTTQTGGAGGTASGNLAVNPGDVLYIYVGGTGNNAALNSAASGGFNGGGSSIQSSANNYSGGGGGGASDVRKGSSDLTSRVIIAGGGGGAGLQGSGGNGGGELGGDGYTNYGQGGGKGGTQTSGGAGTTGGTPSEPGSLGRGGNGLNNGGVTSSAGGGGGYYGGGSSYVNSSAGGGSGYIGRVTSGSFGQANTSTTGYVIITW
jgi:hypothetical protein